MRRGVGVAQLENKAAVRHFARCKRQRVASAALQPGAGALRVWLEQAQIVKNGRLDVEPGFTGTGNRETKPVRGAGKAASKAATGQRLELSGVGASNRFNRQRTGLVGQHSQIVQHGRCRTGPEAGQSNQQGNEYAEVHRVKSSGSGTWLQRLGPSSNRFMPYQ